MKVDFYIDNALFVTTTTSYTFQWNTRNIADGTHTIKAIAYDTGSQATVSEIVTVTVINTGIIVTPTTGFASSGPVGGPHSPTFIDYTIYNPSTGPIEWNVSTTSAWLSVDLNNGVLPSKTSVVVRVSLNSNATSLAAGVYTDTISFFNTTNSVGNTSRSATLTVQ